MTSSQNRIVKCQSPLRVFDLTPDNFDDFFFPSPTKLKMSRKKEKKKESKEKEKVKKEKKK
jgi:hypothetical protein